MRFNSFEEFSEQFDDFLPPDGDMEYDIDEIYVNGETSFSFFNVNDTGVMGAIVSVVDITGDPFAFCMTLDDLQKFNSNISELIEGLEGMVDDEA